MDKNMTEFSKSNSTSMSDDIRQIAQAFLLAKREFGKTGLSGNNAHQRYNYAKIEDIYNAVEGALMNHNIIIWHYSYITPNGSEALTETLCTRLVHTISGQWIKDERFLASEKPGNQGKGAANTYMKKYALLSLCAIATEDDDGEEEEKYIKEKRHEIGISLTQVQLIQAAIKESPHGAMIYKNILGFNKVDDLAQLKAASFESVLSYIKNFKPKA